MNDVGLYIHIPFCERKCPYCDFVSYTDKFGDAELYVSSLLKEAETFYPGIKVDTVYIGGGTPSAIDSELIAWLMQGVKKIFKVSENAEITIEANPNSLTQKKLADYRRCGINRLSIGVQSLNDEILKTLGRLHSAEQAKSAISNAKAAGFDNISIDLMFSVPNQTADIWKADLETAASLDITHISCYGLKIEHGTPFFERGMQPLDDETDRLMYHTAVDFLSANGFEQYEISNFAKQKNQSRHNLVYWNCGSYAGLGAGAHSYISGKRYFNTDSVSKYINSIQNKKLAADEITTLSEYDKNVESLIMGMRLMKGVKLSVFEHLKSADKLNLYISNGFIKETDGRYSFTPAGIDVSNTILADLI